MKKYKKRKNSTVGKVALSLFAIVLLAFGGYAVMHNFTLPELGVGLGMVGLKAAGVKMALITLYDVPHIDGEDNTPGVQQKVLFGRISEVLTFPSPVSDNSAGTGSFADLVTISGNIVMKPGCNVYEMYVTIETSKLDGKLQGETDGKNFSNEATFFHPGQSADILGFLQWSKNSDLFAIIFENDGQARLLGHKGYPAKMISADSSTGDATTSKRGVTFTLKSARKGPAPIFTGKVQLSGAHSGNADNDFPTYFA